MSLNLKYVEAIEIPSKVMCNYSCKISQNGHISIATTSALYVYYVQPLKNNLTPSISMKKYKLLPSPFILSASVGIDINLILQELTQRDFYEGVLSTELSGELNNGSSVEPKIIQSAWSPKIINKYDCCLATLSNTGSLEVAMKTSDIVFTEEFRPIYNISEKYTEMCRETWHDSSKLTPLDQYNELKRRIHETLPTAFVWSGPIGIYCILVVAYACGDISFWKVKEVNTKEAEQPDINFMNVINGNITNVTTLKWITIQNKALLLVGNSKGQVNCLKLTGLNKEQVIINGQLYIWPEADEISVKDIVFFKHLNKCYILLIKGSELIILLLTENDSEMFSSYIFHSGDLAISAVEVIEANKILVVSSTGATKELIISSENSKIDVKWRHFYININWYIYQALNLVTSVNKMLFFLLIGPCKTANSKDDRGLDNLIVFLNCSNDPLKLLLENPSNSLSNCWDCLEAFRCQSIMDKQLSPNAHSFEKNCCTSLYKLNLLLWVSKLSETVYEQTGKGNLTIKSYEDSCHIFNIRTAINRSLQLLKLYENSTLTEFQLHNLYMLNCYLKGIVLEDWILKLELPETAINLLIDVIARANQANYQSLPNCLHCGDRLVGVTCQPPHFDMRCSITFMQILKYPDYKCLLCDSIAHIEVEKEFDIVSCMYCNIPMAKRK